MDSRNGSDNDKVKAIRAAIANGTLTKEEIERRLTYAIQTEYERQPDKRDYAYVLACRSILYEMHTGETYVSRKEESKQALIEQLGKRDKRRKNSFQIAMRALIATGALAVAIVGADMLFHRQWLHGTQSLDEQQYIVSGEKRDPGMVAQGRAGSDNTPQTITTQELDEAVSVLGFMPAMPTWLPEGWTVESYYVKISESATSFRIMYQNEALDALLRFNLTIYPDIESANAEFEQNQVGSGVECNGWMIYLADNMEIPIAVWQENKICYTLTGPMSTNHLLKVITSM